MVEPAKTVVVDCSSTRCRVGYAGDQNFKQFEAVVGQPRFHTLIPSIKPPKYVGEEVFSRRPMPLSYPVRDGIITDWENIEEVWKHSFGIRINPEEHAILLTDSSLNSNENKQKMTEIMFEKFNVGSTFIASRQALSLYSEGKLNGVVVSSGSSNTKIVPILDGKVFKNNIHTTIGGSFISNYLNQLLSNKGHNFITRDERSVVENIKEECCYIAQDFAAEICKDFLNDSYELPDGMIISLGDEQFTCGEAFFEPKLANSDSIGIHHLLNQCVNEFEIEYRSELYNNIMLSGGSTNFKGFTDRLQKEFQTIAPDHFNIIAPEKRECSAWLGGSMYASNPINLSKWVTKDEYNEFGVEILQKKYQSIIPPSSAKSARK